MTLTNMQNKRRLLVYAVSCLVLMAGCKGNKNQTSASDGALMDVDSTEMVVSEEPQDTTPKPMFLYYLGPDYMQMVYWTDAKEPDKADYEKNDIIEYYESSHQQWALQEGYRRNAAQYTKMLKDDGSTVNLKYIGELLKNPDGEDIYPGELHSIQSIPSPGLRYAFVNKSDGNKEEIICFMSLVVTESYLQSRKQIPLAYNQEEIPLPASVVKELETRYKMKSEQSRLVCKGGRYTYGTVQFKGAYRTVKEYGNEHQTALALEVITVDDKVYAYPVEGYYDETDGPTWNADDGGEYFPSSITAFEGPDGLECCFEHGAPESITVGMFYLYGDSLVRNVYAIYHSMIDEQTPLWKHDVAKMQKLYVADDANENKNYTLSKYRYLWIDDDNTEEIWMRDNDDKHGAFFTRNGEEFTLIATEDGRIQPTFYQSRNGVGYLRLSGSAGGSSYFTQIYELKDSRVVHRFTAMQNEGEFVECTFDGKTILNEQGQNYLQSLPKEDDIYIYWNELSH